MDNIRCIRTDSNRNNHTQDDRAKCADVLDGRNWGAFGIQGLAPLFFNIEGTGYVSDQGHLAARFETSYDLLLTQTLILQPEFEINLYSKSDPARLVGAGMSDIDTGP